MPALLAGCAVVINSLVLDDYDIETAAHAIGGFFCSYLSGQVCHSLTRIIVPRPKHDAMVKTLSAIAGKIVLDDPFDIATTSGPSATARQRQTVERCVA